MIPDDMRESLPPQNGAQSALVDHEVRDTRGRPGAAR
jgi:hypothetical protein